MRSRSYRWIFSEISNWYLWLTARSRESFIGSEKYVHHYGRYKDIMMGEWRMANGMTSTPRARTSYPSWNGKYIDFSSVSSKLIGNNAISEKKKYTKHTEHMSQCLECVYFKCECTTIYTSAAVPSFSSSSSKITFFRSQYHAANCIINMRFW